MATQTLELLALICPCRHTGVQGEPGDLVDPVIERLVTRRQRLQGEYLAPCLRSHGNTVADGMLQQLIQWVIVHDLPNEIAVHGIPFQ